MAGDTGGAAPGRTMEEVFISHDTIEAAAATALKASLERLGHTVFVASEDIGLGEPWEDRIKRRLQRATVCIVLCSVRSVRSQWVWMEFGAVAMSDRRVIPVILSDLSIEEVPEPFKRRQLVRLDSPAACTRLLRSFGDTSTSGGARLDKQLRTALDWRNVRPEPAPPRAKPPAFAVDLAHGQGSWPDGQTAEAHVFDVFGRAAGALRPGLVTAAGRGHVVPVDDPAQLYRGHLSDVTGLVMVSPWRSALSPDVIQEIEAWVKVGGGRLLLQGSQYGDRHHDANLGALAARFGLSLGTNIVAPAASETDPSGALRKPYGVPVTFGCGPDAHAVTTGIDHVTLVNSQTVSAEPGGRVLVGTGENLICEPPADVKYRDGRFVPTSDVCQSRGRHPWLGVVSAAPAALCGTGEVIAMGSWQLARDANGDFVDRLLDWLCGA